MRLITAVFFLAFSLVLAIPATAGAQTLNLQDLFTTPAETAQQSLPQTPIVPSGEAPTASHYGQLTDESDQMLGAATDAVDVFRTRLLNITSKIPDIWPTFIETLRRESVTGRASYFLGVAVFAALLLMIGRGTAWLYNAFIARPIFVSTLRQNPSGYLDKLPVLTYRVLLVVVGLTITIGVASTVGLFFYQEHEATLFTVITIFAAYGAFVMVDVIWRMTLSPYLPDYRLPQLGDRRARQLYGWLVGVSALGIFSMTATLWLQALGLQQSIRLLIIIAFNFLLMATVIVMIRANRGAVSDIILAGKSRAEASWVTVIALRLWAPVTTIYLVAAWAKLSFQMIIGVRVGDASMIVPYAVLMVGLMAYATTSYLIERFFTRSRRIEILNEPPAADAMDLSEAGNLAAQGNSTDVDNDGDEEGGGGPIASQQEAQRYVRPRASMRTFEDLARRIASLFAIGAAAWALLYAWGGSVLFAESAILGIIEDLVDIVFLGYIAYHTVRIWIDQKIEEEGGDEVATGPLEGEGGGTGATRLATLLPLVRNFILAIILIAVGLVIATELGVNVAPLFAGAGIVGLAIGFGSQTLVRDILSGAFFLMDDAFRKGEYIDVGEVKGTVEKISIRSFQLRHHLGMLHTIPFGDIQHLTNFSRDWVMMKLPLRVTYDTDVDRVRKLIKKLGLQLLDDPVIGANFIQPLKSQGVIQMDDSAMIIRVKFMTKPGDQWVVRKRVFQEIRTLFDREGIKFAHREVTVRIPDLPKDRPLEDAEVRAIGAAARSIGDRQADGLMPTAAGGDDR